jgi:hypothetical protein
LVTQKMSASIGTLEAHSYSIPILLNTIDREKTMFTLTSSIANNANCKKVSTATIKLLYPQNLIFVFPNTFIAMRQRHDKS